jgi:hypothetical protein
MGARSYLPALARFAEVDPWRGGSCNDYDYACADPVNGADLEGLCNEATVQCVLSILFGREELPRGFAQWLSRRGGAFVYYVDTARGKRAVLSTGACSVPGPKSFQIACKAHDLGYDLMRFFASSGRHGDVRKAVDNNLFNDFKSVCSAVSWWRRPLCAVAARVGYEIVAANSYRQHYGVP